MNEPSITLTGTACGDAELRFTPTGKPVARLTVACNPRRLDQSTGQWVDGTATFWTCEVWGPAAENTAESIRKGDRVIVTGRVRANVWTPTEGEHAGVEQRRMDIVVDEIGLSLRFRAATANRTQRVSADSDLAGAPY
ncbi:MAG: single-stranded DNA-binding protein [Kineosporiaceae bacterium]